MSSFSLLEMVVIPLFTSLSLSILVPIFRILVAAAISIALLAAFGCSIRPFTGFVSALQFLSRPLVFEVVIARTFTWVPLCCRHPEECLLVLPPPYSLHFQTSCTLPAAPLLASPWYPSTNLPFTAAFWPWLAINWDLDIAHLAHYTLCPYLSILLTGFISFCSIHDSFTSPACRTCCRCG